MNIYALQTAKAQDGLPSDGNTLIIPAVDSVHGHRPLWLINLMQAYKCERIKKTFCSTDHPLIKKAISSTVICGESLYDFEDAIDRPENLQGEGEFHKETVKHGLSKIEERTGETVDFLVVLLGNSHLALQKDIDNVLDELTTNSEEEISNNEFKVFNESFWMSKRKHIVAEDWPQSFLEEEAVVNGN